jgi:hypothetical protein
MRTGLIIALAGLLAAAGCSSGTGGLKGTDGGTERSDGGTGGDTMPRADAAAAMDAVAGTDAIGGTDAIAGMDAIALRDAAPGSDSETGSDAVEAADASLGNDASAPSDASGPDAGTGCAIAADCPPNPNPMSVSFCTSSAFSCIQGNCVWDCAGANSCSVVGSQCFGCADAHGIGRMVSCESQTCFPTTETTRAMIEQSTCGQVAGWPTGFDGSAITVMRTSSTCSFEARHEGGVAVLGNWIQLVDGSMFGDFPPLGGTCRGEQAPTGAIRFIFSCPKCQVVLGF